MVPGSTCMTAGPNPELKLLSGIQRILTISVAEPWISFFFPMTLVVLRPRRLHTSGCKQLRNLVNHGNIFSHLEGLSWQFCRFHAEGFYPMHQLHWPKYICRQWGGNVTHDWILSSDWSAVSSAPGTALEYSVDRTLPSVRKWAGSWD